MTDKPSVLVLGQHIQGMIAAALLARNGFSVKVIALEGDSDFYMPFAADYKTGPLTHIPFHIDQQIIDELHLPDHGLEIPDDNPIGNPFEALPFYDGLAALSDSFESLDDNRPSYKEKAWRDTWGTFELGRILAGYDQDIQNLFARSTTLSLSDLLAALKLDEKAEANILAACLIGSRTDPQAKGSAAALLASLAYYRGKSDGMTIRGSLHPLMRALKQAGMSFGVEYDEGRTVKDITAAAGTVTAITLSDGEEVIADNYILDTDPATFFARCGSALSLPPAFQNRVSPSQNLREYAHIHLVLSDIPDDLKNPTFLAPTPDYIHQARQDFKRDGGSQLPFLSIINITETHSGFSGDGATILDIMTHYCDPNLLDDEGAQEAFITTTLQALDQIYPNLSDSVINTGFRAPNSQAGMPNFTGAMPLLQLFKIFFGHHAMGYDMPFDNLLIAGYGSRACAHYHVQKSGLRVANLLHSLSNNAT